MTNAARSAAPPIDLDAAQALADAATPGPWRWGDDNDGNGNTLIRAGYRWDALANLEYTSDENGDFICQARTLLPALIAELRESRRQLVESDKRNDNLFDLANKHLDTIDRVKGVLGEYLDPEDADIECREDVCRFIRDIRAALEGGK